VARLGVAQEAASNALKHGRATRIALAVNLNPDRVELTIDDSGSWLKPHAPIKGTGFGLKNRHERLRELGGALETGRAALGGFHLRATLPKQDRGYA